MSGLHNTGESTPKEPSLRTCRGLSLLLLGPWRSCPWSPPPSSMNRVRLLWGSTPVSNPPSPPALPRAASQGLHRPRPLNASITGGGSGSNISLTPLRRLETTGDCSPDMAEKKGHKQREEVSTCIGSYRSGHLSQNGDILLKWTLQTYSCFPASFQLNEIYLILTYLALPHLSIYSMYWTIFELVYLSIIQRPINLYPCTPNLRLRWNMYKAESCKKWDIKICYALSPLPCSKMFEIVQAVGAVGLGGSASET